MNRAHKLILLAFALVDVAVIGVLAVIVIRSSSRGAPDAVLTAPPPSACVASLLDLLSEGGSSARVNWDENDEIATRVTLDLTLAAGSDSGPPTPQLLWTVLDRLSPSLLDPCEWPPTVTLLVSIAEEGGTQRYAVETSGEALTSWLRGDIDDTEMASLARYRESHIAAP